MKIKAVVFDYGKVICFPPEDGVSRELAEIAQVEKEKFESLRWKFRSDYDRGFIDGPEYYRRILKSLGQNPGEEQVKKLSQTDLKSWKRINPETEKLMEDIKNAGLLLGILSNIPFDFLEDAKKNIPVFSLPDVGIFSCEIGIIKPDEEIYRKLVERLECNPKEVVFFDDLEENIKGALRMDIHAVLWEDPEKARLSLAECGVVL